ncbi:MAG: glycosyltransferase family 4 protein [Acidobacteriota bacterium]
MKLLWITTKPILPPVDGGRLLQLRTLEGIVAAGAEITLVAPLLGAPPEDGLGDLVRECHWVPVARGLGRQVAGLRAASGLPLAIARHRWRAVEKRVAELVAGRPFDGVQVEHIQAMPQARPALEARLPLILRAHNVESDIWRRTAAHRGGPVGWLSRADAGRLARWEGETVAAAPLTAALSQIDADRLSQLAGGRGEVVVVPPSFPGGMAAGEPLPGAPAVVVLGSGGWLPNRDSAQWFVHHVWPAVRQRCPAARLHLFGLWRARDLPPEKAALGIEAHPAPADIARAFAAGSVLAVPLRLGSGVRIKILEAWARGVAVVSTPQGAEGLVRRDGEGLLLARDGAEFAAAVERLADPAVAAELCAEGRRRLAEHHDPLALGRRFLELYASQRPG